MASGTMRTIFSAMIYRQFAANGSADAGYEWLKKLDANTAVYTPTPDDMYLKLDRGVGTVTSLEPAGRADSASEKQPAMVLRHSGVRRSGFARRSRRRQQSQNDASGDDFENFLLEPQLQAQLAKDYYQIPAIRLPDADKPGLARQTGYQRNENRLGHDEPEANRLDELLVPKHQGQGRTVTALTLEGLTKIFPRGGREAQARQNESTADAASLTVVDSIDLKIEDGRVLHASGSLRLWQIDDAAHDRRL